MVALLLFVLYFSRVIAFVHFPLETRPRCKASFLVNNGQSDQNNRIQSLISKIDENALDLKNKIQELTSESTASGMKQVYPQMFKTPRKVEDIQISYKELKRIIPERFLLSNLNLIFRSWRDSWRQSPISFPECNEGKVLVAYDYDHFKYISTVFSNRLKGFPFADKEYHIKLANNGFMYPKEDDLRVFRSGITRHQSSGWVQLDRSYLETDFAEIAEFGASFLGADIHDSGVKCQLFFNFYEDKFDFRMTFDRKLLVVTFEPGYPCDPDLNEDFWY